MNTIKENRDPQLWRMAKARASFRSHFTTYLIVNAFLWALWFFSNNRWDRSGIPWPLFVTLGWGVAVVLDYVAAYGNGRRRSVEREYEKLINKNK